MPPRLNKNFTEGPAKQICDKLVSDLREKLGWGTLSAKWIYLQLAIRFTAKYFVRMYRATSGEAAPEDVGFLFSEEYGGLGKKAVEADLESHFYKTMCIVNCWGIIMTGHFFISPLRNRFAGDRDLAPEVG